MISRFSLTAWWASTALRVSGAAAAGLPIGLIWGAAPGLSATSIGLAAFAAIQLRRLYRFRQWILATPGAPVPDEWGEWGDLRVEVERMRRRGEGARLEVSRALERFMRVAEALPLGVVLLDAGSRIEWCNLQAQSQFAIDLARDRGQVITHLVRYPELIASFEESSIEHQPMVLRTTGDPALVLSVQSISFGESERLLLVRDVTAIERGEAVRRDFIANVSHELRTPLTVVSGYIEHLADGRFDAKAARRPLALMQEQAVRMTRLIEDLLTLSHLEATDSLTTDVEVDMPKLIESIVEDGKAISRGRHVIQAEIERLHLCGSVDELRSAFTNLVTNAIRYTPESGRISVRWRSDSTGARFSVTDTGIGISPDHLPRLSERFYRVDRSRSRETGGTGLGLAIVKHVLVRHAGKLEVASTPGMGSTFTCWFPSSRLIERRAVESADADWDGEEPSFEDTYATSEHRIPSFKLP